MKTSTGNRARRLLQVGARPRQFPLRLRLRILAGNARRTAAHIVPAVETRLAIEPLLDRPHQGLGAQPTDAEFGRFGELFGDRLAKLVGNQPGEFLPRIVDDRVAADTHRQREDSADQSADGFADHPTRRGALAAQLIEEDLAATADQFGPAALERRLEAGRTGDQHAAVGQFDDQHLVIGRLVLLRGPADTTRRRAATSKHARVCR
jgi:hypothetical protein